MGILDVFKKKKKTGNPMDPENMSFVQKMVMKKLKKMSPDERENLMKKVMTPKNINKNRDEILRTIEQMQKSGQMNSHQAFEAKKKLGLL
ncbi:MAG TPA: hypothetical protein PLB52_02700 [Candidatus Moranbacteria bacterium]|nr:hypothetical protein [Candidatus Moranbacteria bacterium]